METTVTAIADGIYRLSTLTEAFPGGFTFNQFLIADTEPQPPLGHLRPLGSRRVRCPEHLWLEAASDAELAIGAAGTMLSGNDQAIRAPRPLADGETLDRGASAS